MAFNSDLHELIEKDQSGLLAAAPHWGRFALGEVCTILNGAPFDSSLFSTEGPHRLVRIRDVIEGRTTTFYAGPDDPGYRVDDGDLLVGMDGDFHCAYWRGGRALLNQRVCRISPDERWLSKAFLAYGLPGYLKVINDHTPSVTVKHLSSKTIASIPFAAPPRPEQDRIVAKLDELLSDLDAGVAELKAAQQKLQRYRQSLLKAAVEGALTAEWRAKNPPAETGAELLQRILRERRARWEEQQLAKFAAQGKAPPKGWKDKYPEPQPPKTEGLPELPEGWVWASADQIVADSSYGTSVKCAYHAPGLPVLRIPNISRGELDFGDLKHATVELDLDEGDELQSGDVLVIRTNGSIGLVGRCAAVTATPDEPHYFASYLLRLRCVESTVTHRWIATFLTSTSGRRWLETRAASSAGQHNISLSSLLTLAIPFPPLKEQQTSLSMLDGGLEGIDRYERAAEASLAQSAAQRQNMLRAAFRGELVPQDPNDEPASVLLERLRAQRLAGTPQIRKRKSAKSEEQG